MCFFVVYFVVEGFDRSEEDDDNCCYDDVGLDLWEIGCKFCFVIIYFGGFRKVWVSQFNGKFGIIIQFE